MAERTQRDIVRELLIERGEAGVSAHELTFQYHITRAAAVIHDLRREDRMNIETKQEQGQQAVYIFHSGPVKPQPPETPGQAPMFEEAELPPPLSWDELGQQWGKK